MLLRVSKKDAKKMQVFLLLSLTAYKFIAKNIAETLPGFLQEDFGCFLYEEFFKVSNFLLFGRRNAVTPN